MGLSPSEDLDIAELVFFAPAILIAGFVVYKHWHQRNIGWLSLVFISLFRTVGAATGIANVHGPSRGLLITSDVMQNFGLISLLMACSGLSRHIYESMSSSKIPARLFHLAHSTLVAGLIMSIVASTDIFSTIPPHQSHGKTLLRAAEALFLAVFIFIVLTSLRGVIFIGRVTQSERRLALGVAASLPFLGVRIIYSLLTVYLDKPKYFSSYSPEKTAVIVHALMGVLPELIIVGILLFVGITTEPLGMPQPAGSVAEHAELTQLVEVNDAPKKLH